VLKDNKKKIDTSGICSKLREIYLINITKRRLLRFLRKMEEYELIEREDTINNKAYWRISNKKEDIEIKFLFNEDLNILKSYEGYTNQIINYKTMRIYGLPNSIISSPPLFGKKEMSEAIVGITKKDIRRIYNSLNRLYAEKLLDISLNLLVYYFYPTLALIEEDYYKAFFILWCFEQTKHFKKHEGDIRRNWEILKEEDFIPYLKWIEKNGKGYRINLKKNNDYTEMLHKIKKYFMPEKSINELFNLINDTPIETNTFNIFLYWTLFLSNLVLIPTPNISILWHNIFPIREDDIELYKKYLPEISKMIPPPVPIVGYVADSNFNTDYDEYDRSIGHFSKKDISRMFKTEFLERVIKSVKIEKKKRKKYDIREPEYFLLGDNEERYIDEMKKALDLIVLKKGKEGK